MLLRSICLPDEESKPGSSCFTSGINKDSKIIDAVPLNLFNHTFCDNHSVYNDYEMTLNKNQLCAGLPSNTNQIAAFNGQYQEDLGGPLICIDSIGKKPFFTGVTSSNSLSTKPGQPGMIHIHWSFTLLKIWPDEKVKFKRSKMKGSYLTVHNRKTHLSYMT